MQTPGGRLVLALLDKAAENQNINIKWQEAEADRAARLEAIQRQGQEYSDLQRLHAEEMRFWQERLGIAESDREARLQVILKQGEQYADMQQQFTGLQQQFTGLQKQYSDLQQQNSELQQKYALAVQLLEHIRHTRLYRLMRQIGRWDWIESAMKTFGN